ncbi:molybdopterin dinucleotide binding domain-containing protein [Streptomyces violascens]|uniref:molybdopterin dinucleotide binding domain-containing protein n=1 Tax=Streptomyces violascens TaxID=67381 RepID=UPI003570E314
MRLAEGDLVEVATPRGAVHARLHVTGMRDGMVFLPFHYGYWDTPGGHRPVGHDGGGPGGRAGGERDHDHRLGPGVQTASVHSRCLPYRSARSRRRSARAGTHPCRLRARRAPSAARHHRRSRRSGRTEHGRPPARNTSAPLR